MRMIDVAGETLGALENVVWEQYELCTQEGASETDTWAGSVLALTVMLVGVLQTCKNETARLAMLESVVGDIRQHVGSNTPMDIVH
jgi:hypothetical protein